MIYCCLIIFSPSQGCVHFLYPRSLFFFFFVFFYCSSPQILSLSHTSIFYLTFLLLKVALCTRLQAQTVCPYRLIATVASERP